MSVDVSLVKYSDSFDSVSLVFVTSETSPKKMFNYSVNKQIVVMNIKSTQNTKENVLKTLFYRSFNICSTDFL